MICQLLKILKKYIKQYKNRTIFGILIIDFFLFSNKIIIEKVGKIHKSIQKSQNGWKFIF